MCLKSFENFEMKAQRKYKFLIYILIFNKILKEYKWTLVKNYLQHIYDKCGSIESFRQRGIPQVDRTLITNRYINLFCEHVQNVEKGYVSRTEADEALDIVWETWKRKYDHELQHDRPTWLLTH